MFQKNSLLGKILRDYCLDVCGIHGIGHWFRVIDYGYMLGKQNKANLKIVTLFGLLHDSRRADDRYDRHHGSRAATYSQMLYEDGWLDLTSAEMDILCQACAGHTEGLGHTDNTIRTCWDADRLDLHRFGWEIDPDLLSTEEAREFISREKPPFIEPSFELGGDLLDNLIETRKEDSLISTYFWGSGTLKRDT